MSIFDKENFIEITTDDLTDAAIVSNRVDERIKKRAFANVLGARLGIKFLSSLGIKSDNYNSLYTIPAVLKDIDISDIATDNGIKIDIRIVKDSKSLCVPKCHFDNNILPDIYIFIVPAQDFMSADFIGAIAPEEIDKSTTDGNYYFLSQNTLYNENSLKNALMNNKTRMYQEPSENEVIKAESMLVNFIDGDILNNEKLYVYDILKRSKKLRDLFKDFEHFEHISTELAHTNEILSDSVLDVLGAQELYKNDNADIGAEVDLDELAQITADDFVEEFIDNEEENMSDNENIIEGEFQELPDDDNNENLESFGVLEELPSDEELASLSTNNEFSEFTDSTDSTKNTENLQEFSEFEGFEGLGAETEPSEILEELTPQDTDISNDVSFEDFDIANNNISDTLDNESSADEDLQNFEEIDNEEATALSNDKIDISDETEDFSSFDTSDTLENFGQLEELQPLEFDNLETIEPDNIEETDNLSTHDLSGTAEDIKDTYTESNETDSAINNTEETDLTDASENNASDTLDELATPIDFSLPELVSSEDLPFFEEINEAEKTEEQNTNSEDNSFSEFEDISAEASFDEPTQDISETENQGFTLDDIAQEIDLDNLSGDLPILGEELPNAELEPLTEISNDNIQEETQASSEAPSDNSSNDEDDMSGLEEFTMDMAEATEKANPNILNTNFAGENIEQPSLESFITEEDNSNVQSLESFDFNILNDDNSQTSAEMPEPMQSTQSDADINLDDINLDELDNFGDEEDGNGTGTSNGNTDDVDLGGIDIDSINLDDIDMNNIDMDNINLDDIGVSEEDINAEMSNIDAMSSLDSIPDMTNDMQSSDYQNPEMYGQDPNMPQDNYTPDFNENDKNTIEALYQDNQQNQIGGDNLDNSFNQNNVNVNPQDILKEKKKKTSPLLGIALIALICAFCYMKKDMILEKFNANKGTTIQQEQNMPIEGETQEDKEDQELLNDNTPANEDEQQNEVKQGIGDIPGEAGGPQDAASMEASLNQNKNQNNVESLPKTSYAKTPEPLASSQIKRLYWEIPQDLTYNESIVNYLKTVGKTMKFAIQSDLLNISEMPYSNKMIVDIVIKKDGSADNITTAVSSGSKQIDSVVLQTVKAALKYVKAPTAEFKNDSYTFSLIINF